MAFFLLSPLMTNESPGSARASPVENSLLVKLEESAGGDMGVCFSRMNHWKPPRQFYACVREMKRFECGFYAGK
jgi:hypothetical protein